MSGALQDVRYAARRLARAPGSTAAAALSLAIGLGAGTTVFGIANSVLLTPLPVSRPDEVVAVYTSESSGEAFGFSSYPDYLDFAARAAGLRDLVAYTPQPLNLTVGGQAELVPGEAVSGNYFGALGVPVALGRPLHPEDDRAGAPARRCSASPASSPRWRGSSSSSPARTWPASCSPAPRSAAARWRCA